MKKKIILFLLVTCFVGATLIPAVKADDPNYIRYGEMVSAFKWTNGAGIILDTNGYYHAAPTDNEGGRILHWWAWGYGLEYDYNDAHGIWQGIYFNWEDHEMAKFAYDDLYNEIWLKYPDADEYTQLETSRPGLQRIVRETPGPIGWVMKEGLVFHQQELPIGMYEVEVLLYSHSFPGVVFWYMYNLFYIV